MKLGLATEPIPVGATVLLLGGEVRLAGPEIANAVAIDDGLPSAHYLKGQYVKVRPIEGLGERSLQAIANGPLMDPNRLYLPAGKCSEDEVRRREAWREERN